MDILKISRNNNTSTQYQTFYSYKSKGSFKHLSDSRNLPYTGIQGTFYDKFIHIARTALDRMNKLYRENINKQICEKRADLELIETLKEWSVAKSNYDSEG